MIDAELTDAMFDYWKRRKAERMRDLCDQVTGDGDDADDPAVVAVAAAAAAAADGVAKRAGGKPTPAQRRELFNSILCNDAVIEGVESIACALTRGTSAPFGLMVQYFMVGPHAKQSASPATRRCTCSRASCSSTA